MPKIWNKRNKNTPPEAKYCGRPSIFGNPFIVGVHGTQGECCDKHEKWLETGESFGNPNATSVWRQLVLDHVHELKGLDLECWCYPKRCHCETLAKLAGLE